MPNPSRPFRACATCGAALKRVPRRPGEAADFGGPRLGRYRCTGAHCGWEGLLLRTPRGAPRAGAGAGQPQRAGRSLWLLLLVALVLAAVVAVAIATATWYFGLYAGSVAGRVALGESYDGDPLPAAHPLQVRHASWSPGPASAVPGLALAPPPLVLRRGCAWGRPGGNPYRGTVEQALVSAALPAEVVQAIAQQVHARAPVDQLEITNQAIRAQGSGRVFSTHNIAMTYGMTLCVGTRVNFKPGHMERAALYEASDKAGRVYAVMVPEVCGNVSVLGEQASAKKRMAMAGGAAAPDLTIRWMPAVLDPNERAQASGAGRSGFQSVPEPGTLGCVLGGLAIMGWFWRRRGR